jgi:hypothetical protein
MTLGFTMCIPPDDGCLVRPKHVAMCIYDYCNKGCVLSGCIFIVAYYNVPSVLTNEFLKDDSCHYQNFNSPGFSFNGYKMRFFSLLSPQW